jgi:parallel beta-helix repeat protein
MRRAITILIVSALLLAVQPWPSAAATVVTLGDDGWSADIGTWDPVSRVATLSGSPAQGTRIEIVASDLVLDGNGFALTGTGYGAGYGVRVYMQGGITIKNLTVQNFDHGISMEYSWGNTLSNNTMSGHAYNGIRLSRCSSSTLDGNTVTGNGSDGIVLVDCDDNTLSNNIARGHAGVSTAAGIAIIGSYNNIVTGNLLQENSYGLSMNTANSNQVYRNRFIDNIVQACVFSGSGNLFSLPLPEGGNYWSNHTQPDSNGDGIVDVPYGFDNAQVDELPWATPACSYTPPPTTPEPTIGDAFVTGGGWFNSPAGAFTANPSAVGKANLSLVCKYKKKATVPTGNVNLQFSAARMHFKSTSFEGMAIDGGLAWCWGQGTVNGAGGYSFIIALAEGKTNGKGKGGADMVRVKIWDEAGSVIYDTQPGSADWDPPALELSGGNLKVH